MTGIASGVPLTPSPVALRPHPQFRQSAVARITVEVHRRPDDAIQIRYVMTGALDRVRFAPPAPCIRREDLWRTTCLEAFMFAHNVPAYYEANFSPSGEWAAYNFDSYRTNRQPAVIAAPPRITTERQPDRFVMEVVLDATWVPPDQRWRIGLSAVIEATDGTISYWALAHPPGRPDFHHRDCFVLELAATQEP